MGKTKRFSRYKFALETLRTNGGRGDAVEPDAGTVLAEFKKYNSKQKKITINRAEDSLPEAFLEVSIRPFAYGGTDDSLTIVPFSQRVSTEVGKVADAKGKANHVVADITAHDKRDDFEPAKVTVYVVGTTITSATSQITGVTYKKKDTVSYTMPYGAGAANQAEATVRQEIITAVKPDKTVRLSFNSEKF